MRKHDDYTLYILLAVLSVFILITGCGSGNSDADDAADSEIPPVTDDATTGGEETGGLVFTEIMYNPGDDQPEFLELVNNSDATVDISGYTFSEGIEYTFENGITLGPGEIIVLSDFDPDDDRSLADRLPAAIQLFAPYYGQLDNSGEEIELRDAAGNKVCDITYGDESPWPVAADGFGYSMVVADPTLSTWGNGSRDWLASASIGGTPGTLAVTDAMPDKMIRVNEVLSHTDSDGGDAIELYNEGAAAVDISGWYLTDDKDDYAKFQIPDGTVIEPYGYLSLFETYDPTDSENHERFLFGDAFQLSAHGEATFLFATKNGVPSGYIHGFSFGEVENNISFGRYTNASGKIQFVAQKEKTLGAANSGPFVGDIVISEIMYHADGVVAPCNFVEITNTSNNAINLFDPDNPDNTWKINGMDFSFPGGEAVRSGERIILLSSEPMSIADFREFYHLENGIRIFKYDGTLKTNRQTLEVMKPEDPLEDGSVKFMVMDRAGYDEDHPGLEDADGSGVSLERIDLRAYGDDYTNWTLSVPGGTPGY